jgi:hypothetical protein
MTPIELSVSAADCGTLPVHDAALLPGGLTLAALGEAGVRLAAADGRSIVQWDRPATHLVVSEQGDRALALIKRGDIWQISRIDVPSRRAVFWQDAALHAFAPDYDGALWFIGLEDVIIGIQAASESFDALWREPKLGGRIVAINRSPAHLTLLISETVDRDDWGRRIEPQSRLERRTYALPQLVLRDRNELPAAAADSTLSENTQLTLGPEGLAVQLSCSLEGDRPGPDTNQPSSAVYLVTVSDPAKGTLFREQSSLATIPLPMALSDSWAVISTRTKAGVCCRLMDRREWRVRARIELERAEHVSTRLLGSRCTISDNLGRLIAIDLETGELLRNLRVR